MPTGLYLFLFFALFSLEQNHNTDARQMNFFYAGYSHTFFIFAPLTPLPLFYAVQIGHFQMKDVHLEHLVHQEPLYRFKDSRRHSLVTKDSQ